MAKCFLISVFVQPLKYVLSRPQSPPPELPCSEVRHDSWLYVSNEGWHTKTPELRLPGHPKTGATENSSLSKGSSIFVRTRVSALRNTQLE